MNRYRDFGIGCAAIALIGWTAVSVSAQQTTQGGRSTTPPATQGGSSMQQGGQQTAAPARQGRRSGGAAGQPGNDQGPAVPAGTTVTTLGSVRLAKAVKADGQNLPAGTYTLRVTERQASPDAPGQTPQYERWAEFLQGGQVKGREVVTIVPQSDIAQVAEQKPPAAGAYRAEVLKGGDYYRVWYHKGNNHYLVHFNIG